MTETKTFYALTNGFSTDRFKSEKPTEVPEDSTVEEREVVWNPELEKLTEGYAFGLYRRSQVDGKARIDFQGDRTIQLENLPEALETLTEAGVTELTISHEWSNWQAEFRIFLRGLGRYDRRRMRAPARV